LWKRSRNLGSLGILENKVRLQKRRSLLQKITTQTGLFCGREGLFCKRSLHEQDSFVEETQEFREAYKSNNPIWEETHSQEKRSIHMREGAFMWETAHSNERRCIHVREGAFIWERTHSYGRRRIHMRDDIYVTFQWHDSFTCHTCSPHRKAGSLIWVTSHMWLFSDMTHSHVKHVVGVYAYVWHDS